MTCAFVLTPLFFVLIPVQKNKQREREKERETMTARVCFVALIRSVMTEKMSYKKLRQTDKSIQKNSSFSFRIVLF